MYMYNLYIDFYFQMSDREIQADEVQALESIFSKEEFSSTNKNGVFHIQFHAFITLPEDFKIVFRNLNETGKVKG